MLPGWIGFNMAIHVTPIPRLTTLTTPAFTLGTSNAAGDALTAVASNSTILTYDTTVPTTVSSSASAATGSATVSSRRDHVHGAPAFAAAATEEQMEDESSTSAFATPGRMKYNVGTMKVMANHAADGTLNSSYNVDSSGKDSTGLYTITITNDLSSALYFLTSSLNSGGDWTHTVRNLAVGSYKDESRNAGTLADAAMMTHLAGTFA